MVSLRPYLQHTEEWTEEDMERYIVVGPKTRVSLSDMRTLLKKTGFLQEGRRAEDEECEEDFMMALFFKADTEVFLSQMHKMFSFVVDKYGEENVYTHYNKRVMECVWASGDKHLLQYLALFIIANEDEIQQKVRQASDNARIEHFLRELKRLVHEHLILPYNDLNGWSLVEMFVQKCCMCYLLGPAPTLEKSSEPIPVLAQKRNNGDQILENSKHSRERNQQARMSYQQMCDIAMKRRRV